MKRLTYIISTFLILAGMYGGTAATRDQTGAEKDTNADCPKSNDRASYRCYEVRGNTKEQLKTFFKDKRPGGFWARADWYVSYRYDYEKNRKGGCKVTRVTVTNECTIEFPVWVRTQDAIYAASNWKKMVLALKNHEENHCGHGEWLSREFKKQALKISTLSCRTLKGKVKSKFDSLLSQARNNDQAYDEWTNHGLTEGVRLE